MALDAADLYLIAKAADPNVSGVSPVAASKIVEAGWVVVTRADGLKVRVDTVTGVAPLAAAQTAILNADLSAAAVQARWDARQPERTALHAQVAGAVTANTTYVGLFAPTAKQQTDQIKALTQQMNAVLKRLSQID